MGVTENYSWSNYTATVMGRTLIGIKSLDYDKSQKVESTYGKGSDPTGWGKGQKESSGKLTITEEEYKKLVLASVPVGGDPLDLPPFPIVGLLEKSNGEKFKDTLPMVCIEKISSKKKQGDTEFVRDIDFKNLMIPFELPL